MPVWVYVVWKENINKKPESKYSLARISSEWSQWEIIRKSLNGLAKLERKHCIVSEVLNVNKNSYIYQIILRNQL